VVGMERVREQIRRAVVSVAGGEPRVMVLHGAQGSGRRTLIREAVAASRREGLKLVGRPDPDRTLPETVDHLGGPAVVPLDGDRPAAVQLAQHVLEHRRPCLALLRSSRPVPSLAETDARHLTPPPLTADELGHLLTLAGRDPGKAEALHRVSRGLPGAALGQLRRARKPRGLTEPQKRLLAETANRAVGVPDLARRMELSLHGLVDLAEPLLEMGLLVELDEGAALLAVPGG